VNNEDQHQQAGDYRSRPRWSAGKKLEAVLRLLRGEPLEELSRELQVEAHRLAAWRDDFLESGKQGLKGSGRTGRAMIGRCGRLSARSAS
jgi:transposase-like protein